MAKSSKPDTTEFPAVFAALKAILAKYAKKMVVTKDDAQWYYLDTHSTGANGKPICFAATRLGARYVSYYFMPIYGCTELRDGLSDELRRRMQGKACFNFTAVDPKLFKELAGLTAAGHKLFKNLGYA